MGLTEHDWSKQTLSDTLMQKVERQSYSEALGVQPQFRPGRKIATVDASAPSAEVPPSGARSSVEEPQGTAC